MKIEIFYFSCTNNTEKISDIIKNKLIELGVEIKEHNLAIFSEREKSFDITQVDGVIFGFPIYAWRAPKIMREWISTLNGNNLKAALFFTYGGVHVGAAHSDTITKLDNQGFNVLLSAEFLGKHTYSNAGWDISLDRPNTNDIAVAKKYAELIFNKFNSSDAAGLTLEPFKMTDRQLDRLEKTVFTALPTPSRKGKDCSLCRSCEELCPFQAMDADLGEADKKFCVRCLKCLINCPDEVLEMDDLSKQQEFIMQSNKLTKEVLDSRVSKIIQ